MWNKIKPYLSKFALAISIPIIVGLISAFLTRGGMDIYNELKTPPLSPPSWLFPIVWIILYILMGISSALVYINKEKDPKAAMQGLKYYAVSLAFNFLWSILFFNARLFLFSFVWLLGLLLLIILTIVNYKKVSPVAAYLQIPYAIWVIIAGYLNFGIWILNP